MTPDVKVTSTDIKRALADKHYKDFFMTEVKSGPTYLHATGGLRILDGLAIRKSWTDPCFTGYEVKISRGDFLRDAKFYTYEELVNCLYIVCPKGMIDRTELPDSMGLMWYDPEKRSITTKKKAIYRKIDYSPELLLYIIFSRLDSDRYPFFGDKTEYFKAFLEGKRECRDLGRDVSSKLIQENARLEQEVASAKRFESNRQEYKRLLEVMSRYGIIGWSGDSRVKALDKALSNGGAVDLSKIKNDLQRTINYIDLVEKTVAEAAKNKGEDATWTD